MFRQYEPNVKAVIAFLDLIRVKVNPSTVNQSMHNHPDYPSMLCITDVLNSWDIPCAAGKIAKQDIELLPLPFLAPIHDNKSPIAIVVDLKENDVIYKLEPYSKKTSIKSREAFFQKWDGIYLLAEPVGHSGEKNYARTRKTNNLRTFVITALVSLVTMFPAILLNQRMRGAEFSAPMQVAAYLLYFLQITGLLITSLLLWYEVDKTNPALQKVCGSLKKGNCEAVLTSNHSKLFNWLSWSEVGFFYFAGSCLFLSTGIIGVKDALIVLFTLNVLAAPYILFSVFYQWRIAKQWCALCLAVQFVLFAGLVNGLASGWNIFQQSISLWLVVSVVITYLLPAMAWYTLKPIFVQLVMARNNRREHLQLKFNNEVFNSLLNRQMPVQAPVNGLGISLGNPKSKNKLIKVCNPYCGPCAKAHPAIENLIDEFKDIHVQVIFACNNGEYDRTAIPAKHLLSIDGDRDRSKIKKALDDWYLAKEKNYDDFAIRHPTNGPLDLQDDRLNEMKQWCQETDIKFTPTFFINGRQLPKGYNVEDLKYFLSE